jgi:hypothetical protein
LGQGRSKIGGRADLKNNEFLIGVVQMWCETLQKQRPTIDNQIVGF